MKKLVAVLAVIGLLVASASPVSAEQKRTVWDMDRLTVLPSDQVRALFGFSALTSIQDDHSWITGNIGSNSFQTVLAPCSSLKKIDTNYTACIEKVSYRRLGASSWQSATLSSVQLGEPTTTIVKGKVVVGPISSDEKNGRPGGDKATLWSMPGSPHSSGKDYLLRTRFIGSTDNCCQMTFKSELIPSSYPANKGVITQDKLRVEEFSKGFEYQVRLRMGVYIKSLTGWFFGRISDPKIDRNGPEGYLEITGSPAFVPIGLTKDISVANADEFFDPTWCTEVRKKTNGPCGSINRLYDKAFTYTNEEGWDPADLGRWESAPGGVRTVATLSSWSLDSSFFYQMTTDTSAVKCTTDLYGVSARVFQGAVFSNATLFQTSPPTWDGTNKSFVFKVASPHLDEKGMPNKGFYTLYIPTEMAKCRWGEDTSSARAEVQIISADGKASITTLAATTEDRNFRFNIAGFGYSSPTIKIRMGNDIPLPLETKPLSTTSNKTIAIKCVKGKTVKKVVAIKPVCPTGYKKVAA
jgi:hypothetical protein